MKPNMQRGKRERGKGQGLKQTEAATHGRKFQRAESSQVMSYSFVIIKFSLDNGVSHGVHLRWRSSSARARACISAIVF